MASGVRWPPYELESLKNQLDILVESVKDNPKTRTIDEQAWLTRFLVIRSCGYLEQSVIEVVRGYVRERSYGFVKSWALSHLGYISNPTSDNLCNLVGRLDANLSEEFRKFLDADDQLIHRSLSALVDKRHKIAHGLNEGVNRSNALGWHAVVLQISDWFIDTLDPRDNVANRLKIKKT